MAFKTWTVGEVLASADLNRYAVQQNHVIKAADESVASSTVMQNDDHLLLPVAANTRYLVDSLVKYFGEDLADMKFGWTAPAGATLDWYSDAYWTGTSDSGKVMREVRTLAQTQSCGCSGASFTFAAALRGTLNVGGTAGNLQLQWAQVTSNGTANQVLTGSLLRVTRLVP
ncbi:hypothetical protein Aph01nite_74110 [Acrocarpospora phusangensis]|uniref:Uncharacterized protein n=1 Tax=Acrocarpospora phusangensis TaxID=1070424 RepID=A0A919UP08_9ACTN|nr:hypothetical protein [Acrocarpospora phusangensis]GIH29101.1 hypothetical protein Aph01nite_74110 [Acrocarpospora phusangensis]